MLRLHRRTELPGNDLAGEVIQDSGQVIRAAARYLKIRKIDLPHLVQAVRLIRKFIRSFEHNDDRLKFPRQNTLCIIEPHG